VCASVTLRVRGVWQEEILAVARAKTQQELRDAVAFRDAGAETAPRLEGLFVAKPEVMEIDQRWLSWALIKGTPL